MIRILGGGVALLSVVCRGTAQCAGMITPAAGVLFTTDWAIPGITIAFSGVIGIPARGQHVIEVWHRG